MPADVCMHRDKLIILVRKMGTWAHPADVGRKTVMQSICFSNTGGHCPKK